MTKLGLSILLSVLITTTGTTPGFAVIEDVCISKITGEIRLGTDCTDKESVGSQVIQPSKISIIQQLKEEIASYEAEIRELEAQLTAINLRIEKSFVEARPTFPDINESNYKTFTPNYETQVGVSASRNLTLDVPKKFDFIKRLESMQKSIEYPKRELKALLNNYKTISCKKGRTTVTISDKKPSCPKGYKRAG